MDSTKFSKPISLKRIHLDDGFWKPEMELLRKEKHGLFLVIQKSLRMLEKIIIVNEVFKNVER